MKKIRKAVIPAAGYGTRMLPITKTISKEMLPLVDKPIIQVVVEELVAAGIEDIIMVVAAHKGDLVDYFGETEAGLTAHLQAAGPSKEALLKDLEAVHHLAHFAFIEQRSGVYGTGVPVLDAEPYLGGEPFIYTFADDFFVGGQNSFSQLIETYEKYGASVVAAQTRTAESDYKRYGYVGGDDLEDGVVDMHAIIEHPGIDNKPGDLASLGGFIVTPEVLPYLHRVHDSLPAGKELYFNGALGLMLTENQRIIAREIKGAQYFDTGNKLEYMKTVTTMAMNHPEIGQDYRAFLQQLTEKE